MSPELIAESMILNSLFNVFIPFFFFFEQYPYFVLIAVLLSTNNCMNYWHRIDRTVCSKNLWMPCPWRCSKPDWMGPWAAWYSIRYGGWRPYLQEGIGAWWSLMSLPTHAVLWNALFWSTGVGFSLLFLVYPKTFWICFVIVYLEFDWKIQDNIVQLT